MGRHSLDPQGNPPAITRYIPWVVYLGGAILMILAVVYTAVFSPAATTVSTTTEEPRQGYHWSQEVPRQLKHTWDKQGDYIKLVNTPGAAIAATEHAVERIDPEKGDVLWEYFRKDATVCDIAQAWGDVVVIYNAGKGCTDITRLDSQSGQYVSQASYATDQDQARMVFGGDGHLAVVTPHLVRILRDDLVTTAEFGDRLDYANTDSIKNCTIFDVSIGPKAFTVAAQCYGDKTTHVTALEIEPDDPTKPEVVVDVDTKSTEPVTTPITTLAQTQFITQGNNPTVYTWQLDKDKTEVSGQPIDQGKYGWGSWDFPGVGYVWLIGDTLNLRYGSEDVSQTTHKLENVSGYPVEADSKILAPTYDGFFLWDTEDGSTKHIKLDKPFTPREVSLVGGTIIGLEDGTLKAFSSN